MLQAESWTGFVVPRFHGKSVSLLMCWRVLALIGAALLLPAPVTAASAQPSASYPAQPSLAADRVCVSSEGVFCFRRDTLEPVWSALHGEHTLEPVVADGYLLVGSSRGVYAFEVGSGRKVWHRPARGLVFTPTVAAGTAFVGDRDGHLTAIDLEIGQLLWQRKFADWKYPPAVLDELLVTGGRSGALVAIDRRTGTTRWHHDLGSELVYRPIAADNAILATAFDGQVIALTTDGAVAWRQRDSAPSLPPVVSGNRAVFATIDGTVRARALEDGHLLWRRQIGSGFKQSPRIHGEDVGLVDSDGRVFILDMADGANLLSINSPGEPIGAPVSAYETGWTIAYRGKQGYVQHCVLRRTQADPYASHLGVINQNDDRRLANFSNQRVKGSASLRTDSFGNSLDACGRIVNEEELS